MGFFSALWQGVVNFAKRLWNAIKRIFVAIVRLFREVVDYFKRMILDPQKDKPFIGKLDQLKEAIKNAPTKDAGIFRGVYNEATDEIEKFDIVEAKEIDAETSNLMGNDALVVLK